MMSVSQSRFGSVASVRTLLTALLAMSIWVLATGPGAGQTTPLSKLDTDQPIEITADSLEVKQDQNIAIFRGNVDALQGEMGLRADQLTVHYRSSENSEADVNAISRIDAEGSVFLASSQETAQGDVGVYDVENGLITLTQNVVLTRGENVIRGNRLLLNLVTGQSVVDGGVGATRSGGRVRSLFVPKR
ncbi:MAG: lipopolysaccharide transport periplasmic protein LptA [Alphaproteobacteria bacterium]|nr:lipopolysaccharide transport periplasmic protein LptA [Alphaproteobacteria bacterium]|tara:strand:+ start:48 stop:614 length:567 start_codon:yes stop_codon:yes gene_type:complete